MAATTSAIGAFWPVLADIGATAVIIGGLAIFVAMSGVFALLDKCSIGLLRTETRDILHAPADKVAEAIFYRAGARYDA